MQLFFNNMKYKILGIDPGSKKVGLAISDSSGMIAFAFETWALDQKFPDKLSNLIQSENIQQIVVGLNLYPSKHFDARKWAQENLDSTKIPYAFENEDYSTFEALELNPDADKDQAAAQYILQKYLDKNGSRNGI